MTQNFVVTFKEIKAGSDPKKVKIYAPDHARATEWALVQLRTWDMKNSPFEVEELVKPEVQAPTPVKETVAPKNKKAPKAKKKDDKK